MPTRSEVEAYRKAQAAVSAAARGHLASFWAGLDAWDVVKTREALEDYFPALVQQYGDGTATLAADWFEQQTGAKAVLGDPVAEAKANASMRWALGDILKGNPSQALATLSGVLDRFVKQPGRETIQNSAHAAGIGWARVPSGTETCVFCLMLASRGAEYTSASSAGRGRKFHGDCDCVVTPVRDQDDLPKGYDPDALFAQYQAARDAANSGDTGEILSEMRKQQDNAIPKTKIVHETPPPPPTVPVDTSPPPLTPPRQFTSTSDANSWAANNMLDVKTLPKDVQDEITRYTGAGYQGTNRALRTGVFAGSNGKIQREMVSALDEAFKESAVPEDVVVSRVVGVDAFSVGKGKSLADLTGTVYSDKGYLSTALGKAPTGPGFAHKDVTMEITVPKGTPAIWTRPLSKFKTERELLLSRDARLAIDAVEQNPRTGKWLIKATVVPSKK